MMDIDYIERFDVINRYVLGHLTEEEQVGFELYYLEHPEILDEVELVRALKAGLATHQRELSAAPAAAEADPSFREAMARWFRYPAVLAANFAVITILGIGLLLDGDQQRPAGFSGDRAWIGDVRGERAPLEIEIRSASLVLDIDVAMPGAYAVTLLDETGRTVATIPDVQSSSDAILVVFDASRIDAGRYRLNVDAPGNETVVDRELIIRIPD